MDSAFHRFGGSSLAVSDQHRSSISTQRSKHTVCGSQPPTHMRFVSMKVPQRWKFRGVNDVTTDNNSSK
ncbi:hypothetical protein M404DRAFT_999649 [Pisolithus tinctorius Marx 270]|uniref:Uncharacterized protein n=1 Tax=Pisolithus tinctorius Marx 270 TaxID=870435 RepID=A0A0C3JA77_PISTI|nr:hypothetical protein M404DRAFT_999649 [Pisolithus tinctorius Marx 270]